MHIWIRSASYPWIIYVIRVMFPLCLLECAMEAWCQGHQYGMIEVDCARKVEIRLVKTWKSNSQEENPNVYMIR
jgi:hypothetical protein